MTWRRILVTVLLFAVITLQALILTRPAAPPKMAHIPEHQEAHGRAKLLDGVATVTFPAAFKEQPACTALVLGPVSPVTAPTKNQVTITGPGNSEVEWVCRWAESNSAPPQNGRSALLSIQKNAVEYAWVDTDGGAHCGPGATAEQCAEGFTEAAAWGVDSGK